MTRIDYATVDVFTRIRFQGNPLAVIPDARELDGASMQRIAAEFNYSESAFVLPPEQPDHLARVRIFTPTDEVPFAGHPNVGTAFLLGRRGEAFGRAVPDVMRFGEAAGPVDVALERSGGEVVGAAIATPRPLEVAHALDPDAAAACASLSAADLRAGGMRPVMASVGLPYALLEVGSLEALARAHPDRSAFAEADRRYPHPIDHFAVYLFHRESDARVRARMFAPLSNTPEDPATGSAAAALIAHLAALRPEPDLELDMTIEQGVEMGRPSALRVQVAKRAGLVQPVLLSGRCVEVMSGALLV